MTKRKIIKKTKQNKTNNSADLLTQILLYYDCLKNTAQGFAVNLGSKVGSLPISRGD